MTHGACVVKNRPEKLFIIRCETDKEKKDEKD